LYFDADKSAQWAEGGDSLDAVVAYLKDHADAKAGISGYNDPSGNRAHNLLLAKERAKTVRQALEAGGIGADRVKLEKPVDTTGSGDMKDARRVEVTVEQ
jgi:outer membrane protein OmpA-like peptidoglycan-associated protein